MATPLAAWTWPRCRTSLTAREGVRSFYESVSRGWPISSPSSDNDGRWTALCQLDRTVDPADNDDTPRRGSRGRRPPGLLRECERLDLYGCLIERAGGQRIDPRAASGARDAKPPQRSRPRRAPVQRKRSARQIASGVTRPLVWLALALLAAL